jgi:hypothetical protein
MIMDLFTLTGIALVIVMLASLVATSDYRRLRREAGQRRQ